MTRYGAAAPNPVSGPVLTALALLSMLPAGLVGLWLQILLHELAHAAAFAALGGVVFSIQVGGGPRVLPQRWFGVRTELRCWPRHGQVVGIVSGARAYRVRSTIVRLAGPLASTVFAVALWWIASRGWRPRLVTDWQLGLQLLSIGCAAMSVAGAILSWWPRTGRIGDDRVPSDTLQVIRLWRATPAQLAAQRDAMQQVRRQLGAWESFLAGDADGALTAIAGRPRLFIEAAVFTWARDGAPRALEVLRAGELSLVHAAATAATATAGHGEAGVDWLAAVELAIAANRVFFAAEVGGDDLRTAAPIAEKLWSRLPRAAAVYRIVGLYHLHAGDTARGQQALETAWGRVEPAYLRAITALGLALAHARRGDAAAARRFLRKAARLHPQSPMLARYRALVENALAAAAAVA